MTDEKKCTSNTKMLLNYFSKHNFQARSLTIALSLGFLIAVTAVGYAMVLQAKHGCLTFFTK